MTVVDNLSNLDQGNLAVLSTVYWANAFTTDGENRHLGEVKVSLALPANTTTDLRVELWNDNASLPGSVVVSLHTVANPTTSGTFTYTPDAPASLDANTPYWVVLSVASGAGQYDWNSTQSATQTGVGTIGGVATYFGGGWIASPASDKGIFAVSAPIPEPSSLGLTALACAAGLLVRRAMSLKQVR